MYETKTWTFKAFQYDPYGEKPDWWLDMVKTGKAQEYLPWKQDAQAYAQFGDKRSTHKAFTGDWIVWDEFGRFDVYSYRNFRHRAKKQNETKPEELT